MRVPDASSTRRFYEDLTAGRESRGIWGYEKRFDPDLLPQKPSVVRHFTQVVARWLHPSDAVLDMGCGPGGFLAAAAPYCGSITGVDIVPAFVEACGRTIHDRGLAHARTVLSTDGLVPAETGVFDAAIMVDTIHHCDDPGAVLDDVRRVLKPGGRLLIFEPNKANPALALMCALDRNEWGLLRLGTGRAYRALLRGRFDVDVCTYSGLLVGPEAPWALAIADTVSTPPCSAALGWLSPKLFLAARRTP
jgi:SAM-dependent methyltransferase